ncbi:MAG: hypothetical protein KatS3mg103_0639 [Phycisphaerales bacterium]|nr:MAG: hypothetical protein KatS3mg103_0639 [Phycisphaerales bacterium]
MSRLPVPIVSVIIGEGGSGGALGIAVADRVGMLQHAWYSVISPEGCAAILWKQANERTNSLAASALKLTAQDNLQLGVVDAVIDEPPGGAHRDKAEAARRLERWIVSQLEALARMDAEALLEARYQRYRRLGTLRRTARHQRRCARTGRLDEHGRPHAPRSGRSLARQPTRHAVGQDQECPSQHQGQRHAHGHARPPA